MARPFADMTADDCHGCPMQHTVGDLVRVIFKTPGLTALFWVRVTAMGINVRAVVCFCGIHRKQHMHFINEFGAATSANEKALRDEYSSWIQTLGPKGDKQWMPLRNQARPPWMIDIVETFDQPAYVAGIICPETSFNGNSFVCKRTGLVTDNNPCVGVDPQWMGSNSRTDLVLKNDRDNQDLERGDSGIYDVVEVVSMEVSSGEQPPAAIEDGGPAAATATATTVTKARLQLGVKIKKRERKVNTCQRSNDTIAVDVERFVRATVHSGATTTFVARTTKEESEVRIAEFDEAAARWDDLPWMPSIQLTARMIHYTNTSARHDLELDWRRLNYYSALVIQVGRVVAFKKGEKGGACICHGEYDRNIAWHPSMPTLEKVVAGVLWVMGETGHKVPSAEDGTLVTILPKDSYLEAVLAAYEEYATEKIGTSHAGRRRFRPMSEYAIDSTFRRHLVDETSSLGVGVRLSCSQAGCNLVRNALDSLSREAIAGCGLRQRTAIQLMETLVERPHFFDERGKDQEDISRAERHGRLPFTLPAIGGGRPQQLLEDGSAPVGLLRLRMN
jgi:hypothetical protein